MIDLDEHDDIRYGCPALLSEVDGKVRLYYQSGPSIFGARKTRGSKIITASVHAPLGRWAHRLDLRAW